MKKIIQWLKSPKSDTALFLIALLLLNLVSTKLFFRFDLTKQQTFTLSNASKEVIKNLDQPLSVKAFFTDDLPAPQNEVYQYLEDLLGEYKSNGNRNFSYHFFDMKKEENQNLAKNYGLNQVQVQKVGTSEVAFKTAWMSLVITYGDSIKVLDAVSSTSGLEYKITTTISKMISTADTLALLPKDEKLVLTLYNAKKLSSFGISGFNQLEKTVKDAYEKVNKKNLESIVYISTEPNVEEIKSLVNQYGIQDITFENEKGEEDETALGLVLSYKNKFRLIPLSLRQGIFDSWTITGLNNLEETISKSVQSLVSKAQTVGYITGHEEHSLNGNGANQDPFDSSVLNILLSDIYTVQQINLSSSDITPDINCIIINGPKTEYTDDELYKIDQFLMKGGNVIFFAAPLEEIENGYQQLPTYAEPITGLEKLLSSYGIVPGKDYVFDNNCYKNTQQGQQTELKWAPIVENLDKVNPITKHLGYLIFLQSGSINVENTESNPDIKVTYLAKSSSQSWTKSENIVLYPPYIMPPKNDDEYSAQNLAVLLEGNFNSAFAEDAAQKNTIENQNANITSNATLKKSVQSGKIAYISSEMVTTPQLMDENGSSPMSLFIHNLVDYMNGIPDYCAMRSKGEAIDIMTVKNAKAATFAKLFNQYGLTLLVILIGFIVWRMRQMRRRIIRNRYNPNDSRDL